MQNNREQGEGKEECKKSKKRKNGPTFVVELNDQVNSRCDGYHWRKYGEKPLKSSAIARSYYKCVECNVKKQVEISSGRVLVTYEGIHTHSPSEVIVVEDQAIPKKRKMQISPLNNNLQDENEFAAVSLLNLSQTIIEPQCEPLPPRTIVTNF